MGAIDRYLWWAPLRETGLEQLHLVAGETEVVAEGHVLGVEDDQPFHLWYQVRLDSAWNVRECALRIGGPDGLTLGLRSDGQGHWTDASGAPQPSLGGCRDIDISWTPFTNTLPVRRLSLTPGESAELLVAYISVPQLTARPTRQRYTCLARTDAGGLYRYEGLESHFSADLPVDEQGLVIDYPGIWRRVDAGHSPTSATSASARHDAE